jgi:hypothetical protein
VVIGALSRGVKRPGREANHLSPLYSPMTNYQISMSKRGNKTCTSTHTNREKRQTKHLVGFEVFRAVVMKSIIFWDMTPCSPLSFTRRFGGTYRLHLQGRRIVHVASRPPAYSMVF